MDTVVLLGDASVESDGSVAGFVAALGWELKAEGLCRGEVCVPLRDRSTPASIAAALGRRVVHDPDAAVTAVSADAESRRRIVVDGEATEFTLPDLDGAPRSLGEWAGKRKLLVCWASW